MSAKARAIVASLLIGACGTTGPADGAITGFDREALPHCERSTWAAHRQVVGAFSSTAAAIVHWQETRHGPTGPQPISSFRSRSPSDVVYVCYLDGFFPKAPPPPPSGPPHPSFDRIIVLVAPGLDQLDSAGYQQRMSIVRP
jgi:hypothetical protein